MQRRELLRLMTAVPAVMALPRWSFAADIQGRDRLIYIYLRGGADGLTLCPPVGDPNYYDLRPTLGIAESEALALDAMFGLHPSAAGLKSLYDAGDLAIIHASGLATAQRSHFEAQSATEQGIDATDPAFGTGWVGRYLNTVELVSPLAAVALSTAVPQAMAGSGAALAMSSVDQFGLSLNDDVRAVLEVMYESDEILSPTVNAVFDAAEAIQPITDVAPTVEYPQGELGSALADAGRLINSEVGLVAAAINFGGWDHHDAQEQRMAPLASELGDSLAAFREDIGEAWQETTVVIQTEFGRRAAENASAGTDHGHGGVMFVVGGAVDGGRVVGDWPGLGPQDLSAGEDLLVTTDYRQVLAELLTQRLGTADLNGIFGEWQPGPWQGIFVPRAA